MSGCPSVKGAALAAERKLHGGPFALCPWLSCMMSILAQHQPKWSHLENRWKTCHYSHSTNSANPPPSHRLAMASGTLSIPQQSIASERDLESHGQELVTR